MKLVDAPLDLPSELLQQTAAKLHEGHAGLSVFSTVLVVGCYQFVQPQTQASYPQIAVASRLRKDRPEEMKRLADKLRQVATDLDTLAATHRQEPS